MRRLFSPIPQTARSTILVLAAALGLGGFALTASAAGPVESGGSNSLFNRMRDDMSDVTEFFDTVLPGTLRRYNMILDFSPKFSDVRKAEFIRYPLELRYGISDTSELFAGMTPFSPNPINSGYDHRWGPGEVSFGMREDMENGFSIYDQSTYGIEARVPVGKPPLDVIDGFTHVRPFITGSRRLTWPHTKFYTTYSYDRTLSTPGRDHPSPYKVLRQHILEVDPGILYLPGQYGWFAEYEFRHLKEDIGARLSHGGRIGMIWDIPRERTQKWKLPGKWQVEIAYRVIKEEGRGYDQGIITHVRWRTTLREVLDSDLRKKLTGY